MVCQPARPDVSAAMFPFLFPSPDRAVSYSVSSMVRRWPKLADTVSFASVGSFAFSFPPLSTPRNNSRVLRKHPEFRFEGRFTRYYEFPLTALLDVRHIRRNSTFIGGRVE